MSKIPKDIPTPNPIRRDLSDVVPCAEDDVGIVELVEKEVCSVVGDGGVVDGDVVGKEVVGTGRHIPTAVPSREVIPKYWLLLQQLVGSEPQQ